MDKSFIKYLFELDKYSDRILISPLKRNEIISLEKKLKICFPEVFFTYLEHVGLLQYLIHDTIFETKSQFIREKQFINDIIKESYNIYFPIGHNGFGDIIVMKDKKEDDLYLYLVLHESGKIKKQ